MEKQKCSSKKHEEIDAIIFCLECRIYMCNKCENFHSELFQNHHQVKLNNDNSKGIFTRFFNEKNHLDKLEFFCKNHNKLCCASCIIKIKKKGKGQHSNCNVCIIEDIKKEKKSKLNENINILENLSNSIEKSINELIIIFEKINKNKEDIKMNIQKIFTKIRDIINKREDELLLEADKEFDNIYFKEDIIKESQKLPNKIKLSLKKSKLIDKEWEDDNKLNSLINDCINIENNIKEINIINNNIKKSNRLINLKIKFTPEDENKKEFLNISGIFKNFGKIYYNNNFDDSLIINKNKLYIDSLTKWINLKIVNTELLYRKSKDGDSYETFHKLCDNQGINLILIKSNEGFIIGGYTPLNWDSYTNDWKEDNDTFLFNLTNNKIFRKKDKLTNSIFCHKESGPWFPFIGFRASVKNNMTQCEFMYKYSNSDIYFKDYNEIIPNERKDRFFGVEEVEIYKIIIN